MSKVDDSAAVKQALASLDNTDTLIQRADQSAILEEVKQLCQQVANIAQDLQTLTENQVITRKTYDVDAMEFALLRASTILATLAPLDLN